MDESTEPPAKKLKMEDEIQKSEEITKVADFTEDLDTVGEKVTVTEDKYNNFVNLEELEKLREFQVLDEVRSNDEDSNEEESDSSDGKSDVPEEEIEKMLEEDLPEDFKGARKPKERAYITRQKIVLEEKGVNHFEVLPLDWMVVRHYSGMPVYMHRSSRVCTLSKPYFLGKGNTRRHDIPISAIPCLSYRRALEEEEKQKEIDNDIQEQIKSDTWNRNGDKNKNNSQNNSTINNNVSNEVADSSENNVGKCPFLHNKGMEGNIKMPENHDVLICQKINNDKEVSSFCTQNNLTESSEDVESNANQNCDSLLSQTIDEEFKPIYKSNDSQSEYRTEQGEECSNQYYLPKEIIVNDVGDEEKPVKQDVIHNLNKSDNKMDTNHDRDLLTTSDSQINTSRNKSTTEVSQTSESPDKPTTEGSQTSESPDKPATEDSQTSESPDKPTTEGSQTDDSQEKVTNEAKERNSVDEPTTEANKTNDGQEETNENIDNLAETVDIPLNRQPVVLPGGIVMPPPRVETVSTSWKTQHLTHEQVNNYCKKLFRFKTVNIMHFKRWADRRKYAKARKTLQYPTLPEGTKLITIPAQPSNGQDNGGGKSNKRDWVMSMNGRSYLSVFHEYVRRALQKQPVYEFKQLENASTPYQATVHIGGMQYGVGHGSSKRSAKSAAARASIHILIPEMRAELDQAQPDATNPNEPDFTFFDYVGIEDPRITEFCAATCEPSPHAILRTCLLRNFGAGDKHIHTEMKKLEYQKIELTMVVGKHTATVVCKNKKTAKQRASQAILQALHPHVRSWGSLLRLYGSRSVKSCKEKKLEEQQITLLQDAARHNEPNHAVLRKLRVEMSKLRQRDQAVVPIGTLLLPSHHLPTHSGSNLNNVDL